MKNTFPKLFLLLCLLLSLIVSTTCTKLENFMLVSTGEVNNILTNSADATGSVIDLGDGASQHGHCYAITPNVTLTNTKTQLGIPLGKGGFTSKLENLEAGTLYYIKAYISNGTETVYGKEMSFTTVSASAPTITTTAIASITTTTASSGGNITNDGGAPVTAHGVCWSTSTSPTTADNYTTDGSGTGSFTSSITGLSASTTYYVRAYATNNVNTVYGNELSFTTNSPSLPSLSTAIVSQITQTSATSGGNITSDGGVAVTARGVCWNTATNPTIANSKTSDGSGTGSFVSSLIGLTASTTYWVRAYATNSEGTAYGNELSFTTIAGPLTPPTAAASAATSVTNTTATVNGAVNANGSNTIVTFEYGTTTLYGSTATAIQSPVSGTSATAVDAALTGLTAGTLYHFRVKAVSSEGTTFSDDLTFITLQLPVSTTEVATSVTNTTASLNGTVNATNLSTTVTFEYGTSISYGSTATAIPNPVTGGNPTSVGAGITGLIPQTTYHFRVKAVSTGGTTYGDDLEFTTLCTAPTATTEAITNPDSTTATLNATINANGFATTVTFEYGTTTGYGSSIDATPSPVTGSINSFVNADVTGLSSNTLYHYRVKATNCAGTIYGSDQTFTTLCTAPTCTTTAATSISFTTATLNGAVNAIGCTTTVTFEYGTTLSYGSSISAVQSPVSGINSTAISAGISGLTEGSTYHFRVKAVSSGGTTYGNDMLFTTSGVIPTLTTTPIDSITSSSAICGGNITSDGGVEVTARGICWSTSTSPTTSDSYTVDGTGTGTFTSSITGLTIDVTYYVRAYATNSIGTAYGNEISFIAAPSIGQSYQGGIVAYILQSGDPGYVPGETHGFIAAPSDRSASVVWYAHATYTVTGATGTSLGTGNTNTNTIALLEGTGNYAAYLCYSSTLNGYDDWYLPSKDELNKLYLNRVAIGGFDLNAQYYSSSEESLYYAWYQYFGNGNQSTINKLNPRCIRAVRSF